MSSVGLSTFPRTSAYVVRERRVGGQPKRGAAPVRPHMSAPTVVVVRREVRRRPLELDRAHQGTGQVERRLGMAPPLEFIECPDHAGRTDVQAG
jgi:hypothetical protein